MKSLIKDLPLARKKIYIIPTRFGIVFIAGLFTMLLTAAAYANNLVYLLTFLLTAILLIGMAETHNNIRAVSIHRVEVEPAEEDDFVTLKVWLKNHGDQPKFSVFVGLQGRAFKKYNGMTQLISQKGLSSVCFKFPANKPGVYTLPKLKIFTIFPLGLFYAWRLQHQEQSYFVYPKPQGQQRLPEKSMGLGEDQGMQNRGGDDFRGHEKYIPGENQRHIDWKAYARGRPLLLKKFDFGDPRVFELGLEKIQALKTEDRLRQLSQWVWECHKNQDIYSLDLAGSSCDAGNGGHHLRSCLKLLAEHDVWKAS